VVVGALVEVVVCSVVGGGVVVVTTVAGGLATVVTVATACARGAGESSAHAAHVTVIASTASR